MEAERQANLSHLRATLIVTTLVLTTFGLLAIYSASSVTALKKFGDPFFFAKKQAFVALVGFVVIVAMDRVPLRWIERLGLPSLVGTSLLLIASLFPPFGHRVNGASRWLSLLGLTFQPAEIAKLALLLFLARNLSRKGLDLSKVVGGILPNLLALSILVVPLMLQPDFGSAFLLTVLTTMMLFTAGLPARFLAYAGGLALPGIAFIIYQAPFG